MKIEAIKFAGQVVGLELVGNEPHDRVLLRALANLPAIPDTTGSAPCFRLTLCPKLPWDNLPGRVKNSE